MENNERNKQEAIDLANSLFALVRKELKDMDPLERFNLLRSKYPNFSQAYPTVIRMMAVNLSYNEKAFRRFFAALERDPGKGIEGFIERQADYAKFLYIEECKAKHIHWDMKKAEAVWRAEYKIMKEHADRIREEEAKARSKFAEEKARHLKERRQELLQFIEENLARAD